MAADLHLESKKKACLSFGNLKRYVDIILKEEVQYGDIVIAQKIIKSLHMPEYPIFEIAVNNNDIIIGPIIGLLLSTEDKKLTKSKLEKYKIFVRKYVALHGAIIIFALNKVDTLKRLIEGYCYNPITNSFQKGIFPYPLAIYRKIGLSDKWKSHFLSTIGDKVFNNLYFSKWDMYQWFSQDVKISRHIPFTCLYKCPQNVLDLLELCNIAYIKPISGLRGHGIYRASKEGNGVLLKCHEDGRNVETMLQTQDDAIEYIQKRFIKGRYLIQQAIELIEYKGRLIDFRCVVQKDQAGIWQCRAIIGRCGEINSVVSNISSGGRAFNITDFKKMNVKLSTNLIESLETEIRVFAIDVCNALDESGINCGTLGLDIGVDKTGHLWLIEINNRDPDPSIALNIHDVHLYYQLKTGPLFYAKFLAGFNSL